MAAILFPRSWFVTALVLTWAVLRSASSAGVAADVIDTSDENLFEDA